ncbi:MAG: transporter substrate-binding domain-containing protein [Smithella sp.]
MDEPIARDIFNHTSGVTTLKKTLTSDGYAFAFSKSRPDLQKQVDTALKEMQHNGTLKKIDARWFGKDDAAKVLPDIELDGQNGIIRFATNSGIAPFAYIKHGKIVGYDIEIVMTIASKLGCKLEIIDMDFAAIIPSLISGKSHMAGCGITMTEERAQSVLFSIPNYKGGIVVMVAGSDAQESLHAQDDVGGRLHRHPGFDQNQ